MMGSPAGAAVRLPTAARADVVAAGKRLYYLDNLRVGLVMLVIAHHVGQAYGPTGGYWPIMETARAAILGAFFTVNRSFFMSLFFMISGYFTVMSFEAAGARRFVESRLLRLGLPVLWWALAMIPMQVLVFKRAAWPVDIGHLWFIEHLLIYSLVFALWRVVRDRRAAAGPRGAGRLLNPPGPLPIVGLALLIALVSGIVRTWYPIDRWVILFGFLKVAWADVPRDLAFFIAGLLAYRNEWFRTFPARAGLAWLGVGLAASLLWVAYASGLMGAPLPWTVVSASLPFQIWEGVLCCGLGIGLTVLFRERLNRGGRLTRAMGQAQYAAYIWHVPIVLLCQLAVLSLPLPPLVKFGLVTVAAIPLSFLFARLVRRPLRL
ncbi:MAG TPA: acyltransferase family protein [Anaerolineae bacterium]